MFRSSKCSFRVQTVSCFSARPRFFKFDVWRTVFQLRSMSAERNRVYFFALNRTPGRAVASAIVLAATIAGSLPVVRGAEATAEPSWRQLPLITDGKVDSNWIHVGWGGFVADDGALRTDCDPKGLGLLVYRKEKLGNCQIRVVFKAKEAKSNSGVYVRMADGVL